ncbi:MAG: hypothetical protein LBM98_00215 [Oscillospiraceae bacterium]|nr:hypothetical protein [Oscillospiraceae bacterium]
MPGGQHTSYVLRLTSIRIAGYYVNPGLLRRISSTTYRKCGGGFAMTGRGKPSPHSGALRRSGLSAPCAAQPTCAPPSKAPLFRGGKRPQTRGVRVPVQTNVSDSDYVIPVMCRLYRPKYRSSSR